MKELWCWRCQAVVPMLDEEEWALMEEAAERGMEAVEEERQSRGIEPMEPLEFEGGVNPTGRARFEMFRLLTGAEVIHTRMTYFHRISRHGPSCPRCGKPLRTDRARYCVACGYGQEEFEDDPRPLVEREALREDES